MKRLSGILAATVIVLFSQSAEAQDLCQSLLVGNTYTCTIEVPSGTFVHPGISFTAPGGGEVQTAFQGNFGFATMACACTIKGKVGKLGSSEKSAELFCIEATFNLNEALIGKVVAKGDKIIKMKYLANNSGDDTGVMSCIKD